MARYAYTRILSIAALAVASACGAVAHADTYTWATWTGAVSGDNGTATGTLALGSGLTVTYNGQVGGIEHDTNWQPASTYAGGPVSNTPNSPNNVWMTGGTTNTETITFSQAVTNPAIALWSLGGQYNITSSFNFTPSELFSIVACGPSQEIGGSCITQSGQSVYGDEGNGTIVFNGTYTSLAFTTPTSEYWYSFTVGADALASSTPPAPISTAATPEPSSLALLGTGLTGIAGLLRRRFRVAS